MFQEKNLEANIELTRKEMEEPTEVEIELKRRLSQMTDHLIQKQAQVCHSKHVFLIQWILKSNSYVEHGCSHMIHWLHFYELKSHVPLHVPPGRT